MQTRIHFPLHLFSRLGTKASHQGSRDSHGREKEAQSEGASSHFNTKAPIFSPLSREQLNFTLDLLSIRQVINSRTES